MGIFTEFYSPAKTRMAFSASALMAFSAAQILHAVASYLILERMAAPKEEQRIRNQPWHKPRRQPRRQSQH